MVFTKRQHSNCWTCQTCSYGGVL